MPEAVHPVIVRHVERVQGGRAVTRSLGSITPPSSGSSA